MNAWRRLIVILISANLGILLWAVLHTETVQYALPMTEPGTPGLILRQEYLQLQQTGDKPLPGQCWQIGPFASEAALRRAWQSLEYITLDMQRRKANGASAMGYRLSVPPSASLKEAELLRESMISAGVPQIRIGADFGLDLGRYADLESAQRQQRIVQQLGIEAVLSSLQSSRVEWWIDSRIRNLPAFVQWQAEQRPAIAVKACR
jgi:hypothetical protein